MVWSSQYQHTEYLHHGQNWFNAFRKPVRASAYNLCLSFSVLTYAWHCCDAAQTDLETVTLVSAEGNCPSFSASNSFSPETHQSVYINGYIATRIAMYPSKHADWWVISNWPLQLCKLASPREGGAPGILSHTPASPGSGCCFLSHANPFFFLVHIAWHRRDPDIIHQDDTLSGSISEINWEKLRWGPLHANNISVSSKIELICHDSDNSIGNLNLSTFFLLDCLNNFPHLPKFTSISSLATVYFDIYKGQVSELFSKKDVKNLPS